MTSPTTHPARKRLLLIATGAFIVLALGYGAWWALFGSHFESTDDAYVHGNLVQITPQVPGTVVTTEADDTEMVKAGQPLVRQVRTLYVQNDTAGPPRTCATPGWPARAPCCPRRWSASCATRDPRQLVTAAFMIFALVCFMRSGFNTQTDVRTLMIPTIIQGAAEAGAH